MQQTELRIPIRGYEAIDFTAILTANGVTNPYKGLWGHILLSQECIRRGYESL